MLLQVVSFFEQKLMIHSSYCEKTTAFCFWTKTDYSRFSCYSNEIWNQAKFKILLLTYNCLESFKQIEQKTPEMLHFYFSLSCRIASLTLYLSENEVKILKMATSILLNFLTSEWDISRTIWRIEVSDCIFHAQNFIKSDVTKSCWFNFRFKGWAELKIESGPLGDVRFLWKFGKEIFSDSEEGFWYLLSK